MRKRLVVSLVVVTALAAVAAPAFGQSKSVGSANRPLRSSGRVRTMKSIAEAHPEVPAANWTNLPSMNKGVAETGGGAFVNKKLYVPGGFDSAGAVYGQMQIYDSVANSWSTDADLLSNLTGLPGVADAAVCSDNTGKIHVIDGTLDGAFIYTSHLVFDPAAAPGAKWSTLPFPSTIADGNYYAQDPGCSFISGKIYLYGGLGETDNNPTLAAQTLTWVYDPVAQTWSDTGKHMITGRFWHGYASTLTRAFVAGGTSDFSSFTPIAKAETFTVAKGWKPMADLPAARIGPGMGLLGSTLAVFGGGSSSFTALNTTVGCVGGPGCGPGPWNDLIKNLNAARMFTSWGSGGNKLYDAGGFNSAFAVLNSAESTA
jgi:hypothetical protein